MTTATHRASRRKALVVGAIWLCLAMAGAAGWYAQRHIFRKETRMTAPASTPEMAVLKYDMAFTCSHEADQIPPRNPEAEQLYQHARWLRNSNLLKDDATAYPAIERLVRIAAAYGHDKANLALRGMLKGGQAHSTNPIKESVDLVEDLINRGIPGGYHDMANYLMEGFGVVADFDLALRYYRRAADLGSPDAQYLIADKLTDTRSHSPEVVSIGLQMYQCAAEQGHALAARTLGIRRVAQKQYQEALVAFQLGVKAGDANSASWLEVAFKDTNLASPSFIGQRQADPERSARYEMIGSILSKYDYRDPKVPEIDQIAPLPPSRIPAWDGKLRWLEALKANTSPPLPSEQRIEEIARAKSLDVKTGRMIKR